MKSDVYKRKVDTPDELLTRIFDAGVRIRKHEDQLRRTTPDFRTRFAKCTEVDGGIFRTFIVICNKFVIIIIIIIIIIIFFFFFFFFFFFLYGLGRLTCSGIDPLPSFPEASTISSSSRFAVEGVFRQSGVVHSFKVVDPVLFVFGSHVLYSRDLQFFSYDFASYFIQSCVSRNTS